jgi:hypothetical protein
VLAAAATITTGCAKKATAGTGGAKTNACDGIALFNRLAQPAPADHARVVRYAEDYSAILKNVSFKERYADSKGHRQDVPAAVHADYVIVQASMGRFRDAVRAAQDNAGRAPLAETAARFHAAEEQLAADRAYTEADQRLQQFKTSSCHA